MWNTDGIILTGTYCINQRYTCSGASLSNTNPTRVGLTLGICDDRLLTNHLSHGRPHTLAELW